MSRSAGRTALVSPESRVARSVVSIPWAVGCLGACKPSPGAQVTVTAPCTRSLGPRPLCGQESHLSSGRCGQVSLSPETGLSYPSLMEKKGLHTKSDPCSIYFTFGKLPTYSLQTEPVSWGPEAAQDAIPFPVAPSP